MYKIELVSVHKNVLEFYSSFLICFLKKSVNFDLKVLSQPRKEKILTILKSPHVNKKSKDQFIVHFHKKTIFCNCKTTTGLLKMLLINKPSSLFIRVKLTGKG